MDGKTTIGQIVIREADQGDLDAIMRLEEKSFPTFWSEAMYACELGRDLCVFLVAEEKGRPRGFALAWLVMDECHLLKLAVDPAQRRRGMGRALMEELLARARAGGANICWLEVRGNNVAGRRFYLDLGFREIGIRKGYYQDTGEDALLMVKAIAGKPLSELLGG